MTRTRSDIKTTDPSILDARLFTKTYTGYCTNNVTCLDRTTNIDVGPGPVEYVISRTMTDEVTPNFYRIQAQGGIINTPMSYTISSIVEPPCKLDMGFKTLSYCSGIGKRLSSETRYLGSCSFLTAVKPLSTKYRTAPPISVEEKNAVIEIASAEAYANIDHTDVNMLVTSAEASKTIKGLSTLLLSAYRILKRVRRLQFKKLLRTTTKIRNYIDLYMEARYELRPLYYDIHGIINAISHESPVVGSRETFRGYHFIEKEDFTDYQFDQYYGSVANLKIPCILRSSINQKFSCRAGILTQFLGLPTGNAFGLQDIPQAAWDLVPFSFIIDWFTNVGTVVAAWTPNVESRVLASWVVTESTVTKRAKLVSSLPKYSSVGPTSQEAINAYCNNKVDHSQTVYTKTRFPFAKRYSPPNFRVNLDPLKLLDLGIIAGNLLKVGNLIKRAK